VKNNILLLFLFFFLLKNFLLAKYTDINKINNYSYETHLYSYSVPVDWLVLSLTKKNIFLGSAGSIASDEFSHYRYINFYKKFLKNFSFEFSHFREENPDINRNEALLKIYYTISDNYSIKILGDVDRQKEYCDIGFGVLYEIEEKRKFNFDVIFNEFQYNRKSSENSNKRYNKIPIQYKIDYIDKNVEKNLIFISQINFLPESKFIISDTTLINTEFDLNNYFIFKKIFQFHLRGIYKKNKEKNINQENVYKNVILKNGILLKKFEHFNYGINFLYNELNENNIIKTKKYILTPEIEYFQIIKEKYYFSHTLYNSYIILKKTGEKKENGYFIKYRFLFNYNFTELNSVNVILSLEKKENASINFGGGALQFIFII